MIISKTNGSRQLQQQQQQQYTNSKSMGKQIVYGNGNYGIQVLKNMSRLTHTTYSIDENGSNETEIAQMKKVKLCSEIGLKVWFCMRSGIAHGDRDYAVAALPAPMCVSVVLPFSRDSATYGDVRIEWTSIFYILSAFRSRSAFLSFLRKIVQHLAIAATVVATLLLFFLLFFFECIQTDIINQKPSSICFLWFESNYNNLDLVV